MNDVIVFKKGDIVKDFFNRTLRELMSYLEAERGSLFLLDDNNNELVLDALYNSCDLNLKGVRQRIGQGIAGKVADIRVPVLVKDIDVDRRFQRNGFGHYHTGSFISIPLFSCNRLMGVINITDKLNKKPFNEKDFNLAVFVCRYACMAVDCFESYLGVKQEKETLVKQKSLLEKYASVGKLAAGVVHEINNPLDGVIRYANILLEQLENNSIAREYLLEVKRGLNRITNITKSLLEFSHQINSDSHQVKKYVNLHDLIDESLDVFSDKLNGKVHINKNYKEDLPKILDFGLTHIFINLIKNALDAMPEGGILGIATGIKDSVVEISFKDTGMGIPFDVKERIFEPFFTTKSIDKGTGLGLSICNEIINKYEGCIDVQSAAGQGSTFTILIPKKHLINA